MPESRRTAVQASLRVSQQKSRTEWAGAVSTLFGTTRTPSESVDPKDDTPEPATRKTGVSRG